MAINTNLEAIAVLESTIARLRATTMRKSSDFRPVVEELGAVAKYVKACQRRRQKLEAQIDAENDDSPPPKNEELEQVFRDHGIGPKGAA